MNKTLIKAAGVGVAALAVLLVPTSTPQALCWTPASSGCAPMAPTAAAMPPAAAMAARCSSAYASSISSPQALLWM